MRSSTKLAMMAGLAIQFVNAANSTAQPMVDITTPKTTLMKDYVPPNDLDNVPQYYYPTDYRIMNCWECFEAQGKSCIDVAHGSMYQHTSSSDPGTVFCCKPDANTGYCASGVTHDHRGAQYSIETVCSEPSYGATAKWQNILTGNRNHQMFAYCPAISHDICGIEANNPSTHMAMKAGLSKKHVDTNKMNNFKNKNPSTGTPLARQDREYDACYYEIGLDNSVLSQYNPKKLHLQISKKTNMNVYIYSGPSRATCTGICPRVEATNSVIAGNQQAAVGQTYSVDVTQEILLIAYPDENMDTDFGFNYWLEAELKSNPASPSTATPTTNPNSPVPTTTTVAQLEPAVVVSADTGSQQQSTTTQQTQATRATSPGKTEQEQQDDMIFYALCGGAGILFIAIIVLCYKCRNKGKIQHVTDADPGFPSGGNHTNENERSMQLEDLDDEGSQRPSMSGKGANMFENDSEKQRRSSYKKVNAMSVKEAD